MSSSPAMHGSPLAFGRDDGFLVDLDGVVWVGDRLVPGAAEAIVRLRAASGGVRFLTNDPSRLPAGYAERLTALGIETAAAEVLCAGALTAQLAARELGAGRRVLVIGTASLKDAARDAGLRPVDRAADDPDGVVVGGHDGFDYGELREATLALARDRPLFATGRDATFPMPGGGWPATGAILAAVETASGCRATVVGKPARHMFEAAARALAHCSRLTVIGDNLDSDIAGGRAAGLRTVWVGGDGAPGAPLGAPRPDLTIPSLAALLPERARASEPDAG